MDRLYLIIQQLKNRLQSKSIEPFRNRNCLQSKDMSFDDIRVLKKERKSGEYYCGVADICTDSDTMRRQGAQWADSRHSHLTLSRSQHAGGTQARTSSQCSSYWTSHTLQVSDPDNENHHDISCQTLNKTFTLILSVVNWCFLVFTCFESFHEEANQG